MYIHKRFAESDISVLHQLIDENPLATWVMQYEGELIVDHIPFILDRSRGEFGTLLGHISKANKLWQQFDKARNSICIFHGIQAYISPNWYASKQEHGKAVPTWNYSVVHAYGQPLAINDEQSLYDILAKTTAKFETQLSPEWTMDDAPEHYISKMLKAIQAVEIPISQLIGKYKCSQNKSEADRLGVIVGLRELDDTQAHKMAAFIEQGLHKSATTDEFEN